MVDVNKLIERADRLHSAPEVAQTLLNLTRDPDFEIQDIVDCVARDPALSARMLRVVNSSRFGLRNKVSNLQQAVMLLGQRSLRLLVMSFSIVDSLTNGPAKKLYAAYWQQAISMATVAWKLSKQMDTAMDTNDAYTGGLLADLGMLLFAQLDADRYVQLCTEAVSSSELVAAEKATFGFDHSAVSGRLLEKWGFPTVLVSAVEQHHTDDADTPLAIAIRSGDLMSEALWRTDSNAVAQARKWLASHHGLDLDEFTDLALSCKEEISLEADLYGVHLAQTIDTEKLLAEASDQFRTTSIETALELDSLAGVLDGPTG